MQRQTPAILKTRVPQMAGSEAATPAHANQPGQSHISIVPVRKPTIPKPSPYFAAFDLLVGVIEPKTLSGKGKVAKSAMSRRSLTWFCRVRTFCLECW
jgi:hypothetical protein